MSWVVRMFENSRLFITDGYAVQSEKQLEPDESLERSIARRLWRYGMELHKPEFVRAARIARGLRYPDPLHVWVLGDPGWTRDLSELFHESREPEGPSYRAVVVVAGFPGDAIYLHSWDAWARRAGLPRARRRIGTDLRAWRMRASAFLETMHESYDADAAAPLRNASIPYEFFSG